MIIRTLTSSAIALPNPHPVAPPGSDGFLDAMNIVAWVCFWLCIVAVMGGGAYLGFGAFTGREMTGGKVVALSIVGAIIIGSASAIVGIFI